MLQKFSERVILSVEAFHGKVRSTGSRRDLGHRFSCSHPALQIPHQFHGESVLMDFASVKFLVSRVCRIAPAYTVADRPACSPSEDAAPSKHAPVELLVAMRRS